jgi:hypothetical protein
MPTKDDKQRKSGSPRRGDAISILRADHRRVEEMFKEFERAHGERSKAEIAAEICEELKVHTQVEEELFYPAARRVLDAQDLLDEAEVEHASAKSLIEEIEGMEPGEHLYDAKVTVLGEYVRHHIKEEQKELFPQVKETDLDLKELGAQIEQRKGELLGEAGVKEKPAARSGRAEHGEARH